MTESSRDEVGFKILVVDGSYEEMSVLTDELTNIGAQFLYARNHEEGLSLLALHPNIRLALIEIKLPLMNGYGLAKTMRKLEGIKDVPIIFVTENSDAESFEFTDYDIGAIDFIFKPINFSLLKSKIKVFQKLTEKQNFLDEKIKELVSAQHALEISQKSAIEADRTKSAFLANMSHEIRTPMTALIGFAELLRTDVAKPHMKQEYVEIIIRNGRHMVELVNEVLDLSKIEAEQLSLEMTSVDVIGELTDILTLLEGLAKKKNIVIHLDSTKFTSEAIHTDQLRFRQIITNVVGNAIKFSLKGDIYVVIANFNSEQNVPFVSIEVRDTGIGIEKEDQALLFRPFSQLSSSSVEGTGLGLCLSKKLAHLLGGHLILKESTPGVGSTFAFVIPASTALEEAKRNPLVQTHMPEWGASTLKGISVMVADDSLDNQMLIHTVLSQFGANVTLVNNGQEAVQHALAHDVDIILMDYKMPILDGFGATEELRKKGYTRPIILLTANAMRGEKEKAIHIGADAYISKPIDWHFLMKQILYQLKR